MIVCHLATGAIGVLPVDTPGSPLKTESVTEGVDNP